MRTDEFCTWTIDTSCLQAQHNEPRHARKYWIFCAGWRPMNICKLVLVVIIFWRSVQINEETSELSNSWERTTNSPKSLLAVLSYLLISTLYLIFHVCLLSYLVMVEDLFERKEETLILSNALRFIDFYDAFKKFILYTCCVV